MAKVVASLALLLVFSASTANGQVTDEARTCSRQAAMWQSLFQDVGSPSVNCARHVRWTLQPPTESHVPRAILASFSAVEPGVDMQPPATPPQTPAATTPPPKAFEYSEAYSMRRKIHFIASFATIPLFVTQYALGEKLFDGSSDSTKSAHSAAAVGIEALFAVNSVTGIWNLWESRKDPNGRGKRFTHSLLMLAADAGFVATGLTAPDEEDAARQQEHPPDRGDHLDGGVGGELRHDADRTLTWRCRHFWCRRPNHGRQRTATT